VKKNQPCRQALLIKGAKSRVVDPPVPMKGLHGESGHV
jgi:hypothetical protein